VLGVQLVGKVGKVIKVRRVGKVRKQVHSFAHLETRAFAA